MFILPPHTDTITWTLQVTDLATGEVLLDYQPNTKIMTASVGKIFVLTEVAAQLADGRLDPGARIVIPPEHEVADSGLLYLFRDRGICVADAALLVGAVSDNLATNALTHMVGLENAQNVAGGLGLANTMFLDYIRNERTPQTPWTTSYGTAGELNAVMRKLHLGEVVSPEVSAQVLSWLAADTDVSMVAGGFHIDPLAHIEPDDGITLRHKTGSISTARIDVGIAQGPAAGVAYACGANWPAAGPDRRLEVEDYMYALGKRLRDHIRP